MKQENGLIHNLMRVGEVISIKGTIYSCIGVAKEDIIVLQKKNRGYLPKGFKNLSQNNAFLIFNDSDKKYLHLIKTITLDELNEFKKLYEERNKHITKYIYYIANVYIGYTQKVIAAFFNVSRTGISYSVNSINKSYKYMSVLENIALSLAYWKEIKDTEKKEGND